MAIATSFIVSCLWFFPLLIRQGKKNASPKRYTVFSILLGLTLGIVVGTMFTIFFSSFLKSTGLNEDSIIYTLIYSLLCAGVAEELSKFACGSLFIKLANPVRKLDYILIMGGAGFGFTLTENILYGLTAGPIAFVRALIPMHIMWQLRMGGHLYEAKAAKNAGNNKLHILELTKALLIPVLFHGIYDFICINSTNVSKSIDLTNLSKDFTLTIGQEISLISVLVLIVVSIAYCIVTEIWAAKHVKASRMDDALDTAVESPESSNLQQQ